MDNLIIPQNPRETPSINFNFSTGVLAIGDESLPEDPKVFYKPIIEKLEEYLATSPQKVVFEMKMVYFNTSSSKKLMDIFELFLKYPEVDTIIKWYYADEDMKDDGDDFVFVLENKLKFEFVFVNKGAS
jgi:hypothetical protein